MVADHSLFTFPSRTDGHTLRKRLSAGQHITINRVHKKMISESNVSDSWPPWERLRQLRNAIPPMFRDPTITQEELRELLWLKEESKRYSRCRASIRKRLAAGASVEPGLHNARINNREYISFSRATLQNRFGEQWVEQISEMLQPGTRCELVIEDWEA